MNASRDFAFHMTSTESIVMYKSLCECYFGGLRLEREHLLFLLLDTAIRYFIESALSRLLWYSTASCINFRTEHWLMPVPRDRADHPRATSKMKEAYPKGDWGRETRSRDGQIFVGHNPWNNRGTLCRDKSAFRIVQQILEIRRESNIASLLIREEDSSELAANWFRFIRRLTLINRGSKWPQRARSAAGLFRARMPLRVYEVLATIGRIRE